MVYAVDHGKAYDPCLGPDAKDPLIAYQDLSSAIGKRPKYPVELGEFNAEGPDKTACVYKRLDDDEDKKKKDPGSLTCSGTMAVCIDDPADTLKCKGSYPVREWHPQAICSFDGGLVSDDDGKGDGKPDGTITKGPGGNKPPPPETVPKGPPRFRNFIFA
ncbi:MAG: hypothetical protein LQ352_002886 [Teloschistes flavicans]|nr:MAG: hypothetical protein LQ352_002886 [Teloschistes flavicans]